MNKVVSTMMLFSHLFVLAICIPAQTGTNGSARNKIEIEFQYKRISGIASNQYAIWVEDENGQYMKTIFVTRFTATKGWKTRPEALPDWVIKSGIKSKDKAVVDVISGATPKTGVLKYYWDFTDEKNHEVPDGQYTILIEGSIRWGSKVIYKAIVHKNSIDSTINIEYKNSGGTDREKEMITGVKIKYIK